ncbi:MAG: trimethylamine methyltransferase family protein [Anaerolineales bacterium]|uniref:Trimethylamine methyltransferase family protein n=1 Tax=Candidatus Desulfolinea nitratireducens TaxID=2841698 RepID=A0A8J6NIJ9_9CHLR|nr:trimethylamine methyltransferase family protein [Candidatus Desulfolinea nitratireducens]MBL6960372.1 trimethylamine methyltransferase family protein [Anaerolineales bacterium]
MVDIKPIRPKLKLDVLDSDELESIQSATLDLLETVGVRFPSDEALRIFAEHGARVDEESQIVRIHSDLVKKALSHAPRSYKLAGRVKEADLLLDGSRSYFGTDGVGVETLDFITGASRSSTKEDVAKMARVADALSSIGFYWPMVSAQDYGLTAPLHEIEASFKNTVKHVQTVTSVNETLANYAIRMAEIISGDRSRMRAAPPLSALICTITPLGQDKEAIEAALVYAKAGIPVGFMAMPTLGSTAPATTGGALVLGNAELVSAIVLMQLVAPGAPVFYSLCASVMDPQTAGYIVGIPEKYLCNTAGVQLAHDWGVPVLAGSFAMDAPEPATWQLGRDSVYTSLMVAMAGADLAEGLGMIKSSTLLVPEQIIFDDEIYHTHRALVEGVDTSIDGLAMDAIKNVGPGGHFLAQKHTRKHLRKIWIPELSHPRISQGEAPSADIRQRARDKFDLILKEHMPEPLEESVQYELQAILDAAKNEIGG